MEDAKRDEADDEAERELLLRLSLAEAVGCDEWSLAAATVLRDAGTIEAVLEAQDRGALRRDYQAVLDILKAELAGEQGEGTLEWAKRMALALFNGEGS